MELALQPTSADCPVRTLAHYKRESAAPHLYGSIIAANADFTCYAIRNGLIRAIGRKSEASTLLRGLSDSIADMRFCPDHDLLAAVSVGGAVLVWRLTAKDDVLTCAAATRSFRARHFPMPTKSMRAPTHSLCDAPQSPHADFLGVRASYNATLAHCSQRTCTSAT